MDPNIVHHFISEYSGNPNFDAAAKGLVNSLGNNPSLKNEHVKETVEALSRLANNPSAQHLSEQHFEKLGSDAAAIMSSDEIASSGLPFAQNINRALRENALATSNQIKQSLENSLNPEIDTSNYSEGGIILSSSATPAVEQTPIIKSSLESGTTNRIIPEGKSVILNKQGLTEQQVSNLVKDNSHKTITTNTINNPPTSGKLLDDKGDVIDQSQSKLASYSDMAKPSEETHLLAADGKPIDAVERSVKEFKTNGPVLGPDGQAYSESATYNQPAPDPRETIRYDEQLQRETPVTPNGNPTENPVDINAESATPLNNIVQWVNNNQRVVGGAELAGGIGLATVANGKRQEINLELSEKELGGQSITFGDRTRQVTANVATLAGIGASLDGGARAATGHGLGYWAEKVRESAQIALTR